MKIKTFLVTVTFLAGFFSLPIIQPANAQLDILLGGSKSDIKQMLNERGYTEINIIERRFATTLAKACHGGIRYHMKILITGKIKWRKKIGRCEREINMQQAKRLLHDQGYRRIDIEARRGTFVAIACLNNARLRMIVDRHGKIRQDRRLGSCRPDALSPTDIKSDLKQQGYTRIRFTDRQLPRYVVEACQGLRKFELVLNRRGDIRKEVQIGRCQRAIDPRDLPRILAKSGYKRVKVIDDKLPKYVAEACYRNRLLEITLNRFGRIIDQFELGQCARPLSREQLLASLTGQGFKRLKVIRENNRGFIVEGCNKQRRLRISFNPYGEILKQSEQGQCKSRSVREITRALADREMQDIKIFVEGCRRGRKLRIEFNRLGDPIGRTRLGRC